MAGTHAQKSPSAAERYHNCAGSIALIASLPPEQKDSAGYAAQKGTAAHALLEWCLRDRTPPSTYRGRLIELVGHNEDAKLLGPRAKMPPKAKGRKVFEVDADMVEGVTTAYAYVIAKAGDATITLEGRTNPLPERDDCHGTADVTIDGWPYSLEVVDYKNGRMVVNHIDNPQLLAYLLGRVHEFGWDYGSFSITVVQPNAFHECGAVRTYTVCSKTLKEFEAKHRAAVERADEALAAYALVATDEDLKNWSDEYLKAGDHCTMCPAAAICPAFRAKLAAEAKADFDAFPITELYEAPDITDPERAAAVVKWAPLMKALIRQAEAYLYNSLAAGKKVEGFKLVRSKTNRVWRDDMTPAAIAKAMVKEGFLNGNEASQLWTEPSLVTGPQAEKLVDKDKRAEFADKFLTKPEGQPKVVPADAAGIEVAVDAFAEFAPLVEDED